LELDDLISSGVIGLMDAIEKNMIHLVTTNLKPMLSFRIRGSILDELRAQDWVPRSVRDKAKLLDRTIVKLEATLGRTATEDEICEALKITSDEIS
jgi:RNA polymerase sigma factor for flagellar operon FliA